MYESCAKSIVSTIGRRAYRRPLTDPDVAALLEFYRSGNRDAGFEAGIQRALERILVSPDNGPRFAFFVLVPR